MEFNKKENVKTNDAAEDLKRLVASLEKENLDLKVKALKKRMKIILEDIPQSSLVEYNTSLIAFLQFVFL